MPTLPKKSAVLLALLLPLLTVSACASPENFDAEVGRRIARENAINKVWPLLGFRLRDELAR